MKRIIVMVAATAVLLTGCGQLGEESEITKPGAEVETSDFSDRNISEINIIEVGGEDGRDNNWTISQINDRKTVVLTDRMKEILTYNISDEDFEALTNIDFSDYIGKKDDIENLVDAVYYKVEIIYDDGTRDIAEVYIPDLWHKLYEIQAEYEPIGVEATEPDDIKKYYAANGIELNVNMNNYSDKAKLLTADDIYLLSYDCGYISGNHPDMMIIENQEQLDYAYERYGLALPPEGLSEDELWYYDTAISEPFNEMAGEYPITDYSYVIEYEEVGCGGYDLKVGALLVDEDILRFVRTADSKTPDPELAQNDVMDGFCYMAAVPKDTLMNKHYDRWTYPDKNDMYQNNEDNTHS